MFLSLASYDFVSIFVFGFMLRSVFSLIVFLNFMLVTLTGSTQRCLGPFLHVIFMVIFMIIVIDKIIDDL